MDERTIALEKKTAFLEHTLEELNQVLIAQQKRLDLLEAEVRRFREQQERGAYIRKPDEETPPPHYGQK